MSLVNFSTCRGEFSATRPRSKDSKASSTATTPKEFVAQHQVQPRRQHAAWPPLRRLVGSLCT
eukprot:3097102-Prymnesium_polylepis.1